MKTTIANIWNQANIWQGFGAKRICRNFASLRTTLQQQQSYQPLIRANSCSTMIHFHKILFRQKNYKAWNKMIKGRVRILFDFISGQNQCLFTSSNYYLPKKSFYSTQSKMPKTAAILVENRYTLKSEDFKVKTVKFWNRISLDHNIDWNISPK